MYSGTLFSFTKHFVHNTKLAVGKSRLSYAITGCSLLSLFVYRDWSSDCRREKKERKKAANEGPDGDGGHI